MGLYSKPSLALLGELINRDNPGLKTTLTPDNFMLLNGPFVTGTNQRNTRVVINGITGSGLVGKKEFYYDRMNIGQLFNGITVVFKAEGSSATIGDLLPSLNEQYGLGLVKEDLANAAIKLGSGYEPTPVRLNIAALCPAYVGTLDIIWTRTPVGIFPDSGPGSKLMLVGDLENGGYFGRVSAEEMISAGSIFTQLLASDNDGNSTLAVTTNLFWIKFAYKGKYLFYPSLVLGNTTWKTLYSKGAVYGDDTTGKFPPADTPLKKQDTVVVFDSVDGAVGFTPRLPTFHAMDPAPGERVDSGELGQLLWRVFTGTYAKGDWDTLPTGTGEGLFEVATNVIWQNSRTTTDADVTSQIWVTSPSGAATTSTPKTRVYAWRPFLQLVDLSNVLLAITDVIGRSTGRIVPPLLNIDMGRDPEMLIRVENIRGTYSIPFNRIYDYATTSEPQLAVSGINVSSTRLKITPTVKVTNSTRINLRETNGELDGF